MKLSDIKTLTEVSEIYQIPQKTLQSRLSKLIEGEDYRGLGKRQATILSPQGIRKIVGEDKFLEYEKNFREGNR